MFLELLNELFDRAKGALEDRVKGYEAGVNDFITKPFEEENILESVEFFL